MEDGSGNGRLVTVTEASAALGVPRRTLGRRLATGDWPTAGWRRGVGGDQRVVDLAVLEGLVERNGASAGSGADPDEVDLVRELREARASLAAVDRYLGTLNAERAELEAQRRELAAQRAAVRKLAADHASARDAYRQREAELAQQLTRMGRAPNPPRPGEGRFTE